jgi:hypothetical protein
MIDTLDAGSMKDLAGVALGNRNADLVVKGAALVNVYTREVLKGILRGDKGEAERQLSPSCVSPRTALAQPS